MTFSVTMPALGESVTEGTVTRWLKAEGDQVSVDEPLLEVSTDKVDTEIPSPVAGTLTRIVVAIDQTVPVGAELAIIADGASSEAVPAAPAPVISAPAPTPIVAEAPIEVPPVAAVPVTSSTSGTVVSMPALGESVTEGTVTRWLKAVGDTVAVDEALLEVSTDKVDTEIPSPASGVILSIDVPVDATVPVGARLALIGVAGAIAAPVAAPVIPVAPVLPTPAPAVPVAPVAPVASATSPDDLYVTPIVRKLAADSGVDLSKVSGSGIGGRIRKEDVLAAAQPAAPTAVAAEPVAAQSAAVAASPLRGTTVPMSRLRKVIAARMVESLHISAQLTTVLEVDVTKIARLRDRAKGAFEIGRAHV